MDKLILTDEIITEYWHKWADEPRQYATIHLMLKALCEAQIAKLLASGDEGLREKIAKTAKETWYSNDSSSDTEWYVIADSILSLLQPALLRARQEGKREVIEKKLANNSFDQIDIPDEVFQSKEAKNCGFTKRSFLEAGWRKLSLKDLEA